MRDSKEAIIKHIGICKVSYNFQYVKLGQLPVRVARATRTGSCPNSPRAATD